MVVIAFLLAALMGVSLGMLGGGGSILAVPILRYVVGYEAKQAIALSLAVVGITAVFGAFRYWRDGTVRISMALAFGAVSMGGAYGGANLSQWFTGSQQLLIFSIIMLLASVSMWFGRGEPGPADDEGGTCRWCDVPLVIVAGLVVGVVTGLVGIGGGFMIVPALVMLLKLPMREAAGTSLVVIAMNAIAGVSGYAGHVEIPWLFLSGFTAVAVVGAFAGMSLARRVPAGHLRRGFAVFVLVTALLILYANRDALAAQSTIRIDDRPGITHAAS